MICNESDGNNPNYQKRVDIIGGMTIYNKEEIRDALKKTGFRKIECYSNTKKHWLCIVAKK